MQKSCHMYKRYLAMLAMLVGGVCAVIFSFYVIDGVVNPDPCYYHLPEHRPGMIFQLFYDFPASEGGHPTPSTLNFVCAFLAGLLPGRQLYLYYRKRGQLAVR